MKRMLMAMLGLLLGAATGAVAQTGADMTQTPLTLLVTQEGNLAFYDSNDAIDNLKYTVNGGAAQSATKGGTISGLNLGDVVAFYCGGTQTNVGGDEIFAEDETTIKAQVYGNPMSLLDGANFATATAVGGQAFLSLFYEDAFLSNHPTYELVLPATTLANGCYGAMFVDCTGLTRTPKLPATALANQCYYGMFYGCTSLTDAYVAAPYTTSDNEMSGMFNGITEGQTTLHTTEGAQSSWSGQTDFSFKAVLADYADGGSSETEPATDPNAPAIASVTHTPAEAEGSVAITYGTDGATLKVGETLLSDVQGKAVTVAVTPKAGYRVVGVTLENVAEPAGITSPAVGQIIGSDGKNYADSATLPEGVTKVAMIAYVNGSNGLAIQLNSSPERKSWEEAKTYAEGLNTSTPIAGGTWRLPTKADWQNMFLGCAVSGDAGANDYMDPIAGFQAKIAATGITWQSNGYWSSTVSGLDACWYVRVLLGASYAFATFDEDHTSFTRYVLGCLAF